MEDSVRKFIEIALDARNHGNHPFGALLLDGEGNIILTAENTVETDRDATAHAERNLVAMATKRYTPEFLEDCTLVSSAEPCPMCSGAIYWGNIGKFVYGLSERRLYEVSDPEGKETFLLSCRDVLSHGARKILIEGPILEDEAVVPHIGFWG